MTWLLSCALKAALLLAASWLGATVLRRGAAAARHHLWTLGVVGALALPLLCWALPSAAALTPITTTRTLALPAMLVTGAPATHAAPGWGWLAAAWALGTLVVLVRLVRGHVAARRLTGVPFEVVDGVEVLRSAAIASPMTVGILRPRILLPDVAWSPARLHAVLLHELGHVRRRDPLVQLAAQLACALYWWNPLAWLAAARLRIEREHACDDLVIAAGVRPSTYATDLLDVARAVSAQAGAIGMVDPSSTEARLRRILDASTTRRPVRARFRVAISAIALAGAVTLACTSPSPGLPDAAPSLGALSMGTMSVREPPPVGALAPLSGDVDLALVTAEVQRRLGTLEACYQRRLATDPTVAGTIVIHWVIDEDGSVPEACITNDTVLDGALTDCVNAVVKDGAFPAPRGGAVDVSIPFVFQPTST